MSRTKVQLVSNIVGNVSGGASFTGIVTASSFVGSITGTASTASFATTSFGLSGSPSITVGTIGATSLNASGVITATEYDITGSSNTFNASGISVGVITATSSVTIGSTNVLTAINAKASTGKAIAMAMVFG